MSFILKCFKTEIQPTAEQIQKINQTIGVCRYVYNFYIIHNKELYKKDKSFMTANQFSVWLNKEYIPNNPSYKWIKDVSSKSVKNAIQNAYHAYQRYFKHLSGFPKLKKKNKSNVKMYFVKNSNTDCYCERHRIKIPTLGWVKLKEKGYIPTSKNGYIIKSGTVSHQSDRYYVSVVIDIPDVPKPKLENYGIGIDLGVKELAVMSNGVVKKNINKTAKVRRIEKQLRREQCCLARKLLQKQKKGESTQSKNIYKQVLKIQKLYQRLTNIRTDYINKTISEIVKTKPSYITIEDLNISGMMKNRHLSKAIASQRFYEFRTKLEIKCKELGIELRMVDRWYPSSKLCHQCGHIKKDLKLSDRTYICKCGYHTDRDYNASLNLRDAVTYKIA